MAARFGDGRDWFFEKRFGLFVHWGLYAIPAWHEQLQWRREVPRETYQKLIGEFNPVRYDPDAWLDLAEAAGMEYACITTKHHDGFCLWNTDATDYNVMNSPYGKDIIGRLAEACRRRRFPLCFYYSVADWHHPNYPNQNRTHELAGPEEGDEPDFDKYMAFLKAQVRELCTRYGEIHGFWWDMNVTGVTDPSVNDMIRSLQPKAVINGRGFDEGDFGTPEREYDNAADGEVGFPRLTEACQSVGTQSWGYREDEDYYSDRYLMESIAKFLAKGGNYLLNVGPMADGTIPPESARILRTIGEWHGKVKDALRATPASHETENREVLLTRDGSVLYVLLFKPPMRASVLLKPIDKLPRKATLLNTGQDVEVSTDLLPSQFQEKKSCLRLRDLPVNEHSGTVLVVKVEFGS